MSETMPIVYLGLKCTKTSVSVALTGVRDQLHGFGLSEDDLGTTEIVLAEALNNVVEHACLDKSEQNVELWVEHENNALQCRIQDDGKPFPGGKLPTGRAVEIDGDLHDLPEGGFGWFLIRTLARDITYYRDNGRNILLFSLEINSTLS